MFRHMNLTPPDLTADLARGALAGEAVETSRRTLGELAGVFADEAARAAMPPETLVYQVQRHRAVPEGTEGGLYFGTSFVEPGTVGDEYFMTKGHFHERRDRGEYYWCIAGRGVLVLSEFAGAAAELKGALLTNPHDTDDLASGLYVALSMGRAEAEGRLRQLYEIVAYYDLQRWGDDFLEAVNHPAPEPLSENTTLSPQ